MPDDKEMHLHLMGETEEAVCVSAQARQDCGEICPDFSGAERSNPGEDSDLDVVPGGGLPL